MTVTRDTVAGLRDRIARGTQSAEEATRQALQRADACQPLNAFLQLFPERALERARAVDSARARGQALGPLAGVPVALKDNICTNFGRTTCASRILEKYESPFSATAAERLERAGAIVIGKTNLDEFAMGSSTENSAFGPSRNPIDPGRVPGGSSGGSAVAVAASVVPGALGSETGGSVRQPASLCGLVGVKPTYGRVSRWGLVAFASSLDQIGPFAHTVQDAAILMDVISGRDPFDSTCADRDATHAAATFDQPIAGLRLGVPREARSPSNHPAVNAMIDRAIQVYRALGATIVDVELPHLKYGIPAYYIVAPAEASSNLARYDGVRFGHRADIGKEGNLIDLYARSRAEGFGEEVQRRIMLGTFVLSSGYYDAYYLTALKARRLIARDFETCFAPGPAGNDCHALLTPATTGPAFKIGEKTSDPLAMYLEDLYTVTANLAGIPAMSIPAGTVKMPRSDGKGDVDLPIGLQITCPAFEEERMFRVARMFEKATAGE